MAQAQHSTAHSAVYTDDPMENIATWFHFNGKLVSIIAGGIVAIVVGMYGYKSWTASVNAKASAALYTAKSPMYEGKLPEAKIALERVVKSYGSTSAGQQASMLLAQVLFEQGQYQAGIKALTDARGSASRSSAASFEALTAAGYEGLNDNAKAAEHYAKAAETAEFASDKNAYRMSQARSLMAGGKADEAKKILNDLITDDTSAASQEAKVRLGEIMAAGK